MPNYFKNENKTLKKLDWIDFTIQFIEIRENSNDEMNKIVLRA